MDTLLPDIDASIYWWYIFYVVSNVVLVTASVIVVGVPSLTAAGVLPQKWGALGAVCGALLAFLGLSGVSEGFITARNNLQIAKYRYYTDKDRAKLIAAYEKDKALAAYVPKAPSEADKGAQPPDVPKAPPVVDKGEQRSEPAGAQPPQKNP